MPGRSYDQYCPVAHALDVLGDRWTLLVLRELLLGPRRYTDIRRALPGISPNLLGERLRMLEEEGLVVQEELEPPAARRVYALTDEGRRARDVMQALARFGSALLPPPRRRTRIRPTMPVYGLLLPFLDRDAAARVHDHYRIVVDGRAFELAIREGEALEAVPGSEPDLVLECDASTLVAARMGRVDLLEAAAEGRVAVRGDEAALRRLVEVFALPRRTEWA